MVAMHNGRSVCGPYNGARNIADGPPLLATLQEISAFLAEVERRAFKQAMFAVRDEDAALDVVQDAMLKLTEKYSEKPLSELPMLFQRILQNTIHDHFRRRKVRLTWTTVLSSLGKGDEKDEDFDPSRHCRQNRTRTWRPIPRPSLSKCRFWASWKTPFRACPRVNGKPFCCVTGKNSM